MRFKQFNKVCLLLLTVIFAGTSTAQAHTPKTREIEVVIAAIDQKGHTLTWDCPKHHDKHTLVWHADTEFSCDGKATGATNLLEGVQATIFYRTPFFGKPYAAKVCWKTTQ